MSVSDVMDIKVYYDENGEPYGKDDNTDFAASGLIISNSTQGSGRLLLAVQDALSK